MGLKKSYLRKMSLELGFEANVEIDANVEVEVDIEPEVEVEVEIEAPEIEIEAEVDAEIELEAQGDLIVEQNLAEPIVDVEVGGNAGGKSSGGGVCNLICSILFLVFFIGDIVTLICLAVQWNYYTTTLVQTYGYNEATANTAMIISIVGVSVGAALWGIL